ncbi:hypothetical protein BS78_05G209600 [Paspalum vaginatum]|nr:hypothetical protein BS78_05G209600 [Paspalum vaginatum]
MVSLFSNKEIRWRRSGTRGATLARPSPSPPSAGGRRPARTCSASTATPRSTRTLGHGKCVDSKPFRAGGHRWKLSYYPNGYTDSKSGRPGVLLQLMEKRFPHLDIMASMTENATAAYDVSVLDVDGNQLYHNAGGK